MEDEDVTEVEVIELGKASEVTHGMVLGRFMETSIPPFTYSVHIPWP